jgi:hypothetical protein
MFNGNHFFFFFFFLCLCVLSLPSLVGAGLSLSLCENLLKGRPVHSDVLELGESRHFLVVFLILGIWENRREREEGVDYRLDCWSGE